jgi:hypothetical protein
MEVNSQLHAPAALRPGETALGTHLIRGSVRPQSRSGRYEEQKYLLSLQGVESRLLGCLARSYIDWAISVPQRSE